MSQRRFPHVSSRALIALALLCAMALSGCSPVAELLRRPADPTPAVSEAQDAPAPAAANEPASEPAGEPFRTEVVLSELQAANKATVPDADGNFCDWLELYNPGPESADLSGCYLSDKAGDPCKWQLGELTIGSGEYALIFASGKDRREGELHTNFALSSKGDTISLASPSGELIWTVEYESCGDDRSLCFDGGETRESGFPTPGYPNTEEGYEAFERENDRHGALVINEAVTYNDDFNPHGGDSFDWVELRNASNAVIDLGEYYVSDKAGEPTKFRFPSQKLEPGELFVFYCGEVSGYSFVHTPFKLDSAGDELYLYHTDGTLSDYVSLHNIPLNCSKGRRDDDGGFFLFSKRTPGTANARGARFAAMRPLSVTEPGIYDGIRELDVELSGEGTIYYTTDGSNPSSSSAVYKGPIHLTKTTQIRAISVAEGKLRSEIATYTYLLDENHTLPVVCVALDPDDLRILYTGLNKNEYDSHTEYYGPDGSFASDCMITLHGAASRKAWAKKSFKVVFRDRYGGDINFDLFGQGITEFHSLNLRGGDSVGMITYREPLSAEVADRVAVEDPFTLDSRFCILYVNGSYWGIYTLREAYSRKYVASHTGSDEDLVRISRAPVQAKYHKDLYNLVNFATNRDMTDPENYKYVADRMDMTSFAQWILLETYFNNIDPMGNVRYAIGNQPDGKWRSMFFDLDRSMTNTDASIYEALGKGHKPSQIGNMLFNLMRSPEFKQVFLETAAGMYANGLHHELLVEVFDRMVEELAPEMDRNLSRWRESKSVYENTVKWQRSVFGQKRDDSYLSYVKAFSGASDETMAELFPPKG